MFRLSRAPFIILMLLCFFVAIYASLYYLPYDLPENAGILINNFGPDLLALHAAVGSVALVFGPFQFLSKLRHKRPRLHHMIGRSYVVAVMISGASGLALAIGTTYGPAVALGFGAMAIAWMLTAFMGIRAAMQGRYDDHRAWMYRSFAVTLAAVTLRLLLPAALVSGVEFEMAYTVISYACWIPNLILIEIWLINKKTGSVKVAV